MSRAVRIMIIAAVLFVGGIVSLVVGIKDKIEYDKPHKNIEEMRASDFYEGRYVEGDIYEVWDEFAYTEESKSTMGIEHDKKVTDHYYVFPLETSFYDQKYMFAALCSRDSAELRVLDKMSDEADDYYMNGEQLKTKIHFVGKVQALKGEYLQFFREVVAYNFEVSASEVDSIVTPFVIRSWQNDNSGVMIGFGIGGVVIGLAGLAFFIIRKIRTGRF